MLIASTYLNSPVSFSNSIASKRCHKVIFVPILKKSYAKGVRENPESLIWQAVTVTPLNLGRLDLPTGSAGWVQ